MPKNDLMSMYRSMHRAYDTLETSGKKYDMYIQIRYDLEIVNFPDLSLSDSERVFFVNYHGDNYIFANNIFICTDINIFKRMCIYDEINEVKSGVESFHDERCIGYICKKYNIPYTLIEICLTIPQIRYYEVSFVDNFNSLLL